MKNLFVPATQREVIDRICLLKKNTQAAWGKMNVAQMLAHCNEAFKIPLSDKPFPRIFLGRLIGWAIRFRLYDDHPYKHNMPTADYLKVNGDRDFETERTRLIKMVDRFYTLGPDKCCKFPHPMFGKLNGEQWGKFMYKHLDHHLKQFGV